MSPAQAAAVVRAVIAGKIKVDRIVGGLRPKSNQWVDVDASGYFLTFSQLDGKFGGLESIKTPKGSLYHKTGRVEMRASEVEKLVKMLTPEVPQPDLKVETFYIVTLDGDPVDTIHNMAGAPSRNLHREKENADKFLARVQNMLAEQAKKKKKTRRRSTMREKALR